MPSHLKPGRTLAVVLLSGALLTSACGLKPEVKEQLAQGGGSGAAAGVTGGTDAG
ncbi:MAG: hypothetical protein JWO60_2206, partial [Frankiales bacterium]|nr:hypothetical protein [Frankiales bacterium]